MFSTFLIFLPLSIAQPPFEAQISTGDASLEIELPAAEFVKQNQDGVSLHTHVFNRSTGFMFLPSTSGIGCYLHLYNFSGQHTLQAEMSPDSNDLEWELDINKSNFSLLGMHSFIIYCNTTDTGGFVRGRFDVTESGSNKNIEQALLISGILLAIILFILALTFKDPNFAIASGMIFVIVGIHMFRFGYIGINNFISSSSSIIIIGIGCYILFRASVEYLNEASGG